MKFILSLAFLFCGFLIAIHSYAELKTIDETDCDGLRYDSDCHAIAFYFYDGISYSAPSDNISPTLGGGARDIPGSGEKMIYTVQVMHMFFHGLPQDPRVQLKITDDTGDEINMPVLWYLDKQVYDSRIDYTYWVAEEYQLEYDPAIHPAALNFTLEAGEDASALVFVSRDMDAPDTGDFEVSEECGFNIYNLKEGSEGFFKWKKNGSLVDGSSVTASSGDMVQLNRWVNGFGLFDCDGVYYQDIDPRSGGGGDYDQPFLLWDLDNCYADVPVVLSGTSPVEPTFSGGDDWIGYYCTAYPDSRRKLTFPADKDCEIVEFEYWIQEGGVTTSYEVTDYQFNNSDNFYYIPFPEDYFHFKDGGNKTIHANVQFDCVGEDCLGYEQFSFDVDIKEPYLTVMPVYQGSSCSVLINYTFDFPPVGPLDELNWTNSREDFEILGQEWTFNEDAYLSDGTQVSNSLVPIVRYNDPGIKTGTVRVLYLWPPCGILEAEQSFTIDFNNPDQLAQLQNFTFSTDQHTNVVDASAATYKSAWPIEPDPVLTANNPFTDGTAGVWRNEAQYAYHTSRHYESNASMQLDGTFSVDKYLDHSLVASTNDSWKAGSTITAYNYSNNPTEVRSLLGIYAATQYDVSGRYQTALTTNSRYVEMAFTSFEDVRDPDDEFYGKSGNFFIGEGVPATQKVYDLSAGLNNLAIVEDDITEFAGVDHGMVISDHLATKVNILCKDEETVPAEAIGKTVMVFDESISQELYSGHFVLYTEPDSPESAETSTARAHSGRRSLHVTSDIEFEQYFLKLEPGKAYMIDAWVSSGLDELPDEPSLGTGLGIQLRFVNQGSSQNLSFVPSGPVVEGWQRVYSSFIAPEHESLFIEFKSGTSSAFYDDLRLFPKGASMTSYVYDDQYRVIAILDENNFATKYGYSAEGNLSLVKKQTERGEVTLKESSSHLSTDLNVFIE